MPELENEVSLKFKKKSKANGSFSLFRCIQHQESQEKINSTNHDDENLTIKKLHQLILTNEFVSSQSTNENNATTNCGRSSKTKQTEKDSVPSTSEQDVDPSLLTNEEKTNGMNKHSRLSTRINTREKKTSASLKTNHRRSHSYREAQSKPRRFSNDDESYSSNDESNDESLISVVNETILPVQKAKPLKKPTTLSIEKTSTSQDKNSRLSPAENHAPQSAAVLPETTRRHQLKQSVSEDTGRRKFQEIPKRSSPVSPAHSEPPKKVSSPTESNIGSVGSERTSFFPYYQTTAERLSEWHRTQDRKIQKKSRFSYVYGPMYRPTLFEQALNRTLTNPRPFPHQSIRLSKQSA